LSAFTITERFLNFDVRFTCSEFCAVFGAQQIQ